ncbi:MAG: hypothetical protein K6T87_19760 [Roseiflexus sp.]|nr:hypothetical protein [Roseiflexus sp.]
MPITFPLDPARRGGASLSADAPGCPPFHQAGIGATVAPGGVAEDRIEITFSY